MYISQTNYEVLKEIRDFMGCGYIYHIGKRKSHWKDAWLYSSGGAANTHYILLHVVDKLIVKKELATLVLSELRKRLKEIEDQKKLRIEQIKKAIVLRKKNWPYRRIGKELGIDFGYIRRLIINKDLVNNKV